MKALALLPFASLFLAACGSTPVTSSSGGAGGTAATSTASAGGAGGNGGAAATTSSTSSSSSGSGTGGAPPAPPPPTLDDYWNGTARWELARTYSLAGTGWPYGYGAGTHVEIAGNTWYLFSRKQHDVTPGCAALGATMGTEVRASTDQGATWSLPFEIIPPTPGTPWECAATDGDAYHDTATGTWHYLFQCLSPGSAWQGCHATRVAADPRGPFVAGAVNPVITPGSLWSKICDKPTDECVSMASPGSVADEGTFDIFHSDPPWIYVGFHGYDGKHGYRGIAKTTDFVTWVAGDPAQGVPSDAMLDSKDADGWREAWQGGNIGIGAGSIVREGANYYSLNEAGDISLGCIPGQNWDLGLFRSTSLTATHWNPLPAGNPILYSGKAPELNGQSQPCNPAYGKLFKDPASGTTYLHYTRLSTDPAHDGIFLLRLVPRDNLLDNGDLWKCSPESWKAFPGGPTNLVVYRLPNNASDANCYLATNCGAASCAPGQSVYQDVPVSGLGGTKVAYGGKFAVEATSGSIEIALFELGADSAIVAQHSFPVTPTSAYATASGEATLDAKTATLRFQIYLKSPETFRADEMFISPE